MREKTRIFVRDKGFYLSICAIAFPVVLQSLITTGVNLMDTLMLTAYGETELSASSLANQFISLFQFMCNGMGFGAAVLTAQYYGSGDAHSIRRVTSLMLRLCIGIALLFTVVSLAVPAQVMRIYTPDERMIALGTRYLRISAATFLLFGLSQTITCVLRSVHQVRLPLVMSIVAFFVNVFFNWVFIFGKLGAPELGIEGAALGTVIARAVEFAIIVGYFFLADKRIGYRIKDLFLSSKEYTQEYMKYCIPVLISDTLLGLGNNMVSVVMGHIGAPFVAANAVVSQLTRMLSIFTQGVSNSASILTGNVLGQGRKKDAYERGITFLALAVLVGGVAAAVIAVFGPLFIRAMDLSEETEAIAQLLIKAVIITVIFSSIQNILTKGVLRGGGDTRFLMVADVLFLWLVSVPLGYLVGIVWKMDAFLTYIALHADWIIKSVWCAFRLVKGKWVENTVGAKRNAKAQTE